MVALLISEVSHHPMTGGFATRNIVGRPPRPVVLLPAGRDHAVIRHGADEQIAAVDGRGWSLITRRVGDKKAILCGVKVA